MGKSCPFQGYSSRYSCWLIWCNYRRFGDGRYSLLGSFAGRSWFYMVVFHQHHSVETDSWTMTLTLSLFDLDSLRSISMTFLKWKYKHIPNWEHTPVHLNACVLFISLNWGIGGKNVGRAKDMDHFTFLCFNSCSILNNILNRNSAFRRKCHISVSCWQCAFIFI